LTLSWSTLAEDESVWGSDIYTTEEKINSSSEQLVPFQRLYTSIALLSFAYDSSAIAMA